MSRYTLLDYVKAFVAVTLFWVLILYFIPAPKEGQGRYYDCSLAEISPDFPLEVKEQCRNLRRQIVWLTPRDSEV